MSDRKERFTCTDEDALEFDIGEEEGADEGFTNENADEDDEDTDDADR